MKFSLFYLFPLFFTCFNVALGQLEPTDERAQTWHLTVDPPTLESITEDLPYMINLTLCFNGTESFTSDPTAARYIVTVSSNNLKILVTTQDRLTFTWEDITAGYNHTLEVVGNLIGVSQIMDYFEMKVKFK